MNRVESKSRVGNKNGASTLQAYVPAIVIKQHARKGYTFKGPCYEHFEAALLYADVCGFSSIAEKLSQLQELDGGSDRLTDLMSNYLGAIIDIIIHHGGDIIEFAGDSFLAMWKADSQNSLHQATLRALQCSLIIQESVGNYRLDVPGSQAIELRLRVQVGAGPVVGSHIGIHKEELKGTHGRLVFILSGVEVDNTILADHYNSPGNVVVTKAAWKLVENECVGFRVSNSPVFQVNQMKVEIPVVALNVPSPSSTLNGRISEYIPHQILEQLEAQEGAWIAEVRNVTVMFVKFQPEDVQPTDPAYLKRLQQNCCDVIEVVSKFDGLLAHYSVDDKGIYAVVVFGIPSHEDDATRAVYTAVQLVKNFHSRNRTLCIGISTGVAVAGSVGNANRTHYTLFGSVVNLAARLMQMAFSNSTISFPSPVSTPPISPIAIQIPSPRIDPPSTSPSTGGSPPANPLTPTKRPLTISLQKLLVTIPSKENVAQSAFPESPNMITFLTVDGQPITGAFDTILTPKEFDPKTNASWIDSYTANTILCDEETYQLARSRFYFVPLDPVQLKGFTKLVKIYTPEIMMNWKQYNNGFSNVGTMDENMVGRETEKNEFLQSMQKLLAAEGGSALLIEGEPGQGKTSLITSCANIAIQKGFSVLMGTADAIETGTPYYALRGILKQLADIKQGDPNELAREKLTKIVPLKSQPYMVYFNPICGLDFQETDESVLMKGNTRSQFLQNMVLGLLQQEARARPTVLVMDDIQWLDSATWSITTGAIFEVHPLLVILGTRPLPSPITPNYKKLFELKVKHFLLSPLTSSEIEQLVVRTLMLRSPPPANLIEYLLDSASGNAFFTRELMLVLKDSGVLKTEDGVATFKLTEETTQQDIPRSLNKVISTRVDRLDRTSKMILRVASVIGRTFLWSTLKSVLPSTEENTSLEDKLCKLEEAGLIIVPELTERDLCMKGQAPFSFKHVTVQQTVYNSLTNKQKHDLHLKVAQWYINSHTNTDTISSILFHHFHSAEMFPEALMYCVKAAEQSMQATAVKEAVVFLEYALASPVLSTLSDTEMARIWAMMGDADVVMVRNVEASNCFVKSLVYYGQQDPIQSTTNETPYAIVCKFLKEIAETQPFEQGSPESFRAIEIASVAYRWSHCLSLALLDVPLYCHATMLSMLFVQKSGWSKYMSGVLGAATNCIKYFAPDHTDNLDEEYQIVLNNHQEFTHTLPTVVRSFNLKSCLSTLLYLGGVSDLQTMYKLLRRIRVYCETRMEMYILTVATSLYSTSLCHKGELERSFEEANNVFKLCRYYGENFYFRIGTMITFCTVLTWMGRFLEANEWRCQLSESLRVGGTKIDSRLHIAAAGSIAYYYICKGEWDTAWETLQIVVSDFCKKISKRAIIFTFIFPYTLNLLSLIAIGRQTNLPYHKEALETAHKILDDFTMFSVCFPCSRLRAAVFTIQLRGDTMDPAAKQQLCLETLQKAQESSYMMDEGWAAFELAKCFEINTPDFNKHYQHAVSTFEKNGAFHFYTEVTKYVKQVT